MKDNKEILNEAFFKRKSRKEALNLPKYEPVNPKAQSGYLSVTDNDAVKERLVKTFGATFGNNSVRSMASRAVKQFPILVSDNIEPETIVMLKKLMEEQYAEYISLMINNQVIDLSDYSVGDENGNIAIQAVDVLSGSQFGKTKVANKAANTGALSADDIFGNNAMYSLLRENNDIVIDVKDETLNSILEDAIIIPSEGAETLVEFIQKNASEIMSLNEMPTSVVVDGNATFRKDIEEEEEPSKELELEKLVNPKVAKLNPTAKEVYRKLNSADIVINQEALDDAINKSVGEFLATKGNENLRDKFEKATFLLQSRRIAGIEYYNYLTLRLGIPVSDAARIKLLKNFRIGDVRDYQAGIKGKNRELTGVFRLTKDDVDNIANNRRLVEPIVKDICKPSLAKAIGATAAGGAIAGGAGLAAGLMSNPLGWTILAGCAVGAGAYVLHSLIKKFRKPLHSKIEGWERVEALIEQLNRTQDEVRSGVYNGNVVYNPSISNIEFDSGEDITDNINNYKDLSKKLMGSFSTVSNMVDRALTESMDPNYGTFSQKLSEEYLEFIDNLFVELAEELSEDRELRAEMLVEATLGKSTVPMTIKYVEKKPGKNALLLPTSISTRTNVAYGSTEIERRDVKDRRYDQPLIMTVKFKERFSDGKFADNELTAVIGILGKIIRIPSEEMEYILKQNNEGNTLDGFFKSDVIKNNIADALSTTKISKDLKGMPKSADIWRNLEKVSLLAAANNISGRRNNNISNAHIVFSQKEIDAIRNDEGIDYLRDTKKVLALMKRYSALTVMIANDPGQRAYIFDDPDNISWNIIPYSALHGKDSSDQLAAAMSKLYNYK